MKLEQYKAIVDFCKENGFTQDTFLNDLRAWGDLKENSPIEDLAECVQDETYETMYKYLMENYG